MSNSDLTSREKSILERYLARVNAVPKPELVPEESSQQKLITSIVNSGVFPFSVDDLVNSGKDDFYDESRNNPKVYAGLSETAYVGVPVSLEKCLSWVQLRNGVVATMPYLVAGLSVAKSDNYLRQRWHTACSEELVGIDTVGIVNRGKPVVIVQHGNLILTPDRIRTAYNTGLTKQNAAILHPQQEIDTILRGTHPVTGGSINLYTVDDIKKGKVKSPFGYYAVVLDFETAKDTLSNYQDKKTFLKNELVIARAGTLDYLEKYFDNIQSENTVGNWHRFNEIDPKQAQGRVLFVTNNNNGLSGNFDLNYYARFVGVAPEAQDKKSRRDARK